MNEVPYARFHQRVLAQLLDALLLFALLSPFIYLLNSLFFPLIETTNGLAIYQWVRLLFVLTVIIYASALCIAYFGATPGKLLLGLKIINQDSGQFLNVKQAALRTMLGWVSILSSIGILLALVDSRRQAAHDKVMHSLVIHFEDDYACMELPEHWRHSL